jgi:monothiol glutaredoxin
MDQATRERIRATIEGNRVVLFMKGVREAPQCGFSAQVVQILDGLVPSYVTVDVLSDPAIRQGIKDYSNWPTIPQLYVGGELVGGCDIVKELFASGELEQKLGVEAKPLSPPSVTVTAAAAENLRAALEGEDEYVRLEVSPRYDHGLSVTAKRPGDFEIETSGLTVLVDRSSAARANGVAIDVVKTADGPAFKITNPNEPARVRPMSASELKLRLDGGDKLELIDVRSTEEREIAQIEGSKLLDQELADRLLELDRDAVLVFHCHHGSRSQRAAEQFVQRGFRSVYNLVGGIDAWSSDVDPDVPRY